MHPCHNTMQKDAISVSQYYAVKSQLRDFDFDLIFILIMTAENVPLVVLFFFVLAFVISTDSYKKIIQFGKKKDFEA